MLIDRTFRTRYENMEKGMRLGANEAMNLMSGSYDFSKLRALKACLKRSHLDRVGSHHSNVEFDTCELLYHTLILKIESN